MSKVSNLIAFTLCFTPYFAFGEDEAKEHFAKAKEHLIEGCIDAVAAGGSVLHGPAGAALAIYETVKSSQHFVEAAKEYNKGKKIQNSRKTNKPDQVEIDQDRDHENELYDTNHDFDNWDKEY